MNQPGICPVCENEIPEDARFECPHCHFELKWLDDEGEIERAKQTFTGELFKIEEIQIIKPEKHWTSTLLPSLRRHIIAGILWEIVYFIIFALINGGIEDESYIIFAAFLVLLPFFLFTAFCSFILERLFIKSFNKQIVYYLLTPVLFVINMFLEIWPFS